MSELGVIAEVSCPDCGAAGPGDARFCEACGRVLAEVQAEVQAGHRTGVQAESVACSACAGTVGDDGYCGTCGLKAPPPRDHLVERPQSWVASVCDRGLRHRRNEDAAALAADPTPGSAAVLVVCDGVSSSRDSDIASLAAARAARDALVAAGTTGGDEDPDLATWLVAATDAAGRAVRLATRPEHGNSPPACTFVAAVVRPGRVVVGCVGDSRGYWLPDAGAPLALTVDDSWAAEQMAAGASREQAESGPQAHAITRWLGVDAPDHTPRCTDLAVDAPGWLLLCSDGLWNYCSPAQDVADLVRRVAAAAGGDPLAMASALVAWANDQGGHDNITVALARLGET
jgi:serine/threonine protein phosphatase PrpC